jgi:large subunit ribosomal protein L10
MRAEKKIIRDEYIERLNESPFFIAVDYYGLTVGQFAELRLRLAKANSEVHVVKNSIFELAAKEIKGENFTDALQGQVAIVTGEKDISVTAKVIKTFNSEFDKPNFKFGYINGERISAEALSDIAELPSLEILRGTLLGAIQAPASSLVRLLNTPASQLARVLQARFEDSE